MIYYKYELYYIAGVINCYVYYLLFLINLLYWF